MKSSKLFFVYFYCITNARGYRFRVSVREIDGEEKMP